MRSKRDTAWETAAKCAVLAKEADDPQEREYFARMRDAWITLANRCEFIDFPDVTEKEPLQSIRSTGVPKDDAISKSCTAASNRARGSAVEASK
jgi:hypothetical protein